MKPHIRILLVLAVLTFMACGGGNSFKAQLRHLDSLLVSNPDSVYQVLEGMREEAQQQRKSSRMYYELLRADAQNKAYIDFTTDSVMLEVAKYYDHHGTANEQMRAHYLLGCTYRDMQDVPMELQCFQEATEKADTTSKDCDLYTLAAIYGQMADIYHNQFLPEEELKILKDCEHIDILNNDNYSAIKAYELRMRAYMLMNLSDSVLSVTKKSYDAYKNLGYKKEAASLLDPAISILIDKEQYADAEVLMDILTKESGFLDDDNNINKNHIISFHDKGRIALYHNNIDSARYCFTRLLDCEKEAAYKGLLSLYEKIGNTDSISKYAKLYVAANDSSFLGNNAQIVEQITAIYNYGRQEKIAREKTIESANAKNQVYIISMVAILLFFAALILYGYLRYKSKERERLYLAQEKTLLKRYNETKDIIANLEKEMASLEMQKEEASVANTSRIEELLLSISNYEKEKEELVVKLKGFNQINEDLDFKAWYEDFIACEATNKLHAKTIVTPNMIVKIEDKLWNELRSQIQKHCPMFLNIIDSYSLNPTYQHIVLLNVFDFSTSEISVLLNKTVQQISNIHNRISKKIFPSSNETRKLKQNLLEILRDKRVNKS